MAIQTALCITHTFANWTSKLLFAVGGKLSSKDFHPRAFHVRFSFYVSSGVRWIAGKQDRSKSINYSSALYYLVSRISLIHKKCRLLSWFFHTGKKCLPILARTQNSHKHTRKWKYFWSNCSGLLLWFPLNCQQLYSCLLLSALVSI